MKYMLLIYGAEDSWTEVQRTACMIESMALCEDLNRLGHYIDSSPLQSVRTATTVRVRDGQALITEGPFTETTEQLGGYYVLDLADLDEAISVATKLPPVTKGVVEIRPLVSLGGLPHGRPASAAVGSHLDPFLLLCYDDEAAWKKLGPEAQQTAREEAASLGRELDQAGQYLSASPLYPSDTATCVRVRDGKRQITDGPFAETHEVLGGYFLILAESREQAIRFAAKHPGARFGSVEVRPVFDVSALQAESANHA